MPRHNRRSVASFRQGPGPSADQGALFHRPLSDRAGHVVALKALVEELLGDRLRELTSMHGGYSYDPASLFLVLLFGYLQGQRSSRKLEEACRFDERYVYLSDGLEPDHATLARFRRRLEGQLEELFQRVCQEAERRQVLERHAMAVDGTKVAAVRSQWRKALAEAEALDSLEEEASTMLSHNKYLVGYNLQVAADPASSLLVGYVATASPADQGQMEGVVEAVERQSGGLPEVAVADKGYDTAGDAHALQSRGVEACMPSAGPRKRPAFTVDPDGTVRCPAGHAACVSVERRGAAERTRYRVSRCQDCPLKAACGVKGYRRSIVATGAAAAGARLRANAFARSEVGRRLMRLRSSTIERVFGQLKGNLGFRRLLLRGLAGARVELGLLALAYNLRRLVKALAPA